MSTQIRNLEADIVVVGGGGAGLIAAVAAAREGADVVLLEKGPQLGGTTMLSVGTIMAACSSYQKAAGINDSAQAHAAELVALAGGRGLEHDPALIALFTENSAGTIEFLHDLGVNFLAPLPQPPFSIDRLHQVMPSSKAYIDRLEKAARKLGIRILLQSPVTRLLRDDDRVAGVEASGPSNERITIKTQRAVILASGDMSANSALLRKYIPSWPDDVLPINPLATGDGQIMAADIGAQIVERPEIGPEQILRLRFLAPAQHTFIQKLPLFGAATAAMAWAVKNLPAALIRPFAGRFLTVSLVPDSKVYQAGAILVDMQGTGIVGDEGAGTQVSRLPEKQCYIVLDNRLAVKFSRWPHFFATAPGVAFAYFKDFKRWRRDLLFTAESVAALGTALGFAEGQLEMTIARVNGSRDEERRLEHAPYHALGPLQLRALPAPITLQVDTQLRVVDQNGLPIKGLFAAGGVGLGKFNLLGHGHGLGWAFTSGRLAGQNACQRQLTA